MLYLEDYLEMIEHLPQELRDRFTEMRELDLAVQNKMDSLDKKSRMFFQQCKRGELQHESMDTEFHSLRREYFKVMEDADEKVAIATQIHELVERYLRRLDSELFKFKCELEADNNGITEILEKRSLELDGNSSTAATALLLSMNQKEERYYTATNNNNLIGTGINSAAGIINSTGSIGTGVIGTGVIGTGVIGTSVISVNSNSSGITALNNLTSAQLAASVVGHQRQRKLEKRRETICTVPVPEKRNNLNQSLPTLANANVVPAVTSMTNNNHVNNITTHVTLPVAACNNSSAVTVGGAVSSTVVRQLPTNLTTHNVLNSNAAAVAAAATAVAASAATAATHANTAVTYNLQQLSGGSASDAIVAAASQAIVATQQMQQGRRTASLKASYDAIHGAVANAWSAAAQSSMQSTATALASSNSHHHHHHHQEKKQKKKLNNSMSLPSGIAVQSIGGSSSGNSITSSSSSISVDSVDMLTNVPPTAISNLSHSSLTLNPMASVATVIGTAAHSSASGGGGGGSVGGSVGVGVSGVVSSGSGGGGGGVGGGGGGAAITASHAAIPAPVITMPSVSSVTVTAIGLPSTALAPGANLTIGENGLVMEQANEGEWSYDPNEPRYCTCNQVSYGDMVACDNDACPYEWFHYPCVGITQPPKGKWYCPKCTASMRRRGNRKN